MPCVTTGPEDEKEFWQKRCDILESMLCSACRVLKRLDYDFEENPRLSEWWESHKEKDLDK